MMNKNYQFSEILKEATQYLEQFNIENPKLNAQLLLCKVCNIRTIDILLNSRIASDYEISEFKKMLKRRSKHEPLQYILGSVDFYNLEIKINENVLIPRPETEQLVEITSNSINLIYNKNLNILDIGTGSGCIALALAKNFPSANVIGIDINPKSIGLANRNKYDLMIKNIHFIQSDINDFCYDKKFDIIISNPPYISVEDFNALDAELYFEPKIALTDFADGLTFYRIIADKLETLCNKNSKLFLEFGLNQEDKIINILEKHSKCHKVIKDFNNINRFLYCEIKNEE